MQEKPAPNFAYALAAIVAAIFLFDLQGAFIKLLGQRYPVPQIMVFRNLFGLLPSILVLVYSVAWKEQGRPLVIGNWPLALARGFLLVVAQMSMYFSLTQLELATVTTLAFAGPVFITVLSIPMFGHRVGWIRGSAVVCGFLGVIMVMQPGAESFTLMLLLPVVAAFFYALISLTSRYFDSAVPTALISLYASCASCFLVCVLVVVLHAYSPVTSSVFLYFGYADFR